MAVLSVGSINIDHVYRVPHIPRPGETIAASAYEKGSGGKGANQSVAAAKAGAEVRHCGLIGPEGQFVRDEMDAAGVDTGLVKIGDVPTGHAIIAVDAQGENAITLFEGSNGCITEEMTASAVAGAGPGDTMLLQNEVNATVSAARMGKERGMRVVYSAAPFEAAAVAEVLPFADILVMNEGEAAQMDAELGKADLVERVTTLGADGARWIWPEGRIEAPAFPVRNVVDTTGAGDCFAGYLAAGLDAGMPREAILRRAQAAAAIQVSRAGAAAAMPSAAEVDAFLEAQA